jgi:hypothetical protein
MSKLAQFFKGSDSHFGIFEPRNHIIALYPDLQSAENAEKLVHYGGVTADDAISVPGEDVVRFAEEHVLRHGLWGVMMKKISDFFATEEVYAERDLEMARQGAGFVAVHCPTDAIKRSVWRTLQPTGPLVARFYGVGGVEHLVGENEHKVEPEPPLPPLPHGV